MDPHRTKHYCVHLTKSVNLIDARGRVRRKWLARMNQSLVIGGDAHSILNSRNYLLKSVFLKVHLNVDCLRVRCKFNQDLEWGFGF